MPTWTDKLLQEVIRLILEAYYEPQMSDHSHGFRPDRGCHTALQEIQANWTGTRWFIEGDIASYFDTIDHEVLMEILAKKLRDNRFLHLIRQLLQSGYLEEWKFHQTISGTPQGGVVSPILANIYLDKLDQYVEKVLIPEYTRGKRRAEHPAYSRHKDRVYYARKKGRKEEYRELRKQLLQIPSTDPTDVSELRTQEPAWLLATPPLHVCVTPPAPGLSKLPIVDGTSRVAVPKKPFVS